MSLSFSASHIRAKDVERSVLASDMQRFLSAGGQIAALSPRMPATKDKTPAEKRAEQNKQKKPPQKLRQSEAIRQATATSCRRKDIQAQDKISSMAEVNARNKARTHG